jgi:hypothetical protein
MPGLNRAVAELHGASGCATGLDVRTRGILSLTEQRLTAPDTDEKFAVAPDPNDEARRAALLNNAMYGELQRAAAEGDRGAVTRQLSLGMVEYAKERFQESLEPDKFAKLLQAAADGDRKAADSGAHPTGIRRHPDGPDGRLDVYCGKTALCCAMARLIAPARTLRVSHSRLLSGLQRGSSLSQPCHSGQILR